MRQKLPKRIKAIGKKSQLTSEKARAHNPGFSVLEGEER
jgi:hypothetical protein